MATVNKDFIVKNGIIAGEEVQGSQIIATTSSLAPLSVTSSAVVNNLNSQYVGGYSIQNIIDRSGVTSVNGTAGEIEVSASTGAIVVGLPSDVNIAGSLTVGENFIVTGSVVTVNSTVVTIDDPVFTLGGDTAPTLDDGKDRGIEFRYYSESAKIGFFGFDDSTGKFTFLTDATNESDVFTGTKATIDAYIDWEDVTNKPSPIIVLDGDVSGSGTMTEFGSASIVVNIVKDFSLTFNGDVSGTGLISDLNSASITLNIQPNSVTLGTDTVGNYISNIYGTPNQVIVTGNGGETASVTLSLPQNIATTSTPTFAGTNFDNGSITTASVTVTINDSATVIDSFSASTFATAEYIIQAKQDTKMTSTKILIMWDGTNAYISEYAIVDSSGGAANVTLSVSESSGILSLKATSPDAASTNIVIKAIRTSINA